MKFSQAIKMSLASVFANRMRSFLTMLGIIIGITSVIVMVAIGQGSAKQVTDAIQEMGTNMLTVSITSSSSSRLTSDEISQLKSEPSIGGIASQISGNATVKNEANNNTASIIGTTSDYESVRDLHTAYGRFITQDDIDNRYKVCDVGIEVLQNIFPDVQAEQYESLIGKKIMVNGTPVIIIGILESKGTSSAGSNDNQLIMPLSSAQRLLKTTTVSSYFVEAASAKSVDSATYVLNQFLLSKYNNDTNAFRVLSQSEMISARNQTANTLTMMLAGIAAISLVVGGIGIMNIMLVSVVERTREIGVRKAIGAKRRDILSQFLIEAVFLSCTGGIVGVLLGVLICLILPGVSSIAVQMQLSVMLMAFTFSAGVGIVFGLYPAGKASSLSPIDALRYE